MLNFSLSKTSLCNSTEYLTILYKKSPMRIKSQKNRIDRKYNLIISCKMVNPLKSLIMMHFCLCIIPVTINDYIYIVDGNFQHQVF